MVFRPVRRNDAATPAERACRGDVEWQRSEVGLGLLEVGLAYDSFDIVAREERSDGELSERDGADQRLVGKRGWVLEPGQEDDGRGVEYPSVGGWAHSRGSST